MNAADQELFDKVDQLQSFYLARATGDYGEYDQFSELRREILEEPKVAPLLPSFVRKYRRIEEFWQFIKAHLRSYAERREYIWAQFRPALEALEGTGRSSQEEAVSSGLQNLEAEHISAAWHKALERRTSDPEGAITAGRTLVESVCKLILDEASESYPESADLPRLYSLVAKRLKLAPNQHTEQVFKQILGGCQSVVEGIGAVRNRLGDAHGQGEATSAAGGETRGARCEFGRCNGYVPRGYLGRASRPAA